MVNQEIIYKLRIEDNYGLAIEFDTDQPEKVITDRSLFGIEDKQLIKDILKKPFKLKRNLRVRVTYKDKVYTFTIPRGFCYDGASIPWIAWVIIGQKTEPRLKLASCVHDWLCEHHVDIGSRRRLSTHVFIALCETFGKFNIVKRTLMAFFINVFQLVFCGWGKRK